MEATEYGDCVDAPLCRERSWNRLLVTERLVRTRFVVKADVLGDDAAEVILTEHEDVVEQLSPERTGEAFSEGIHVRRTYRRAHDAHPRRPEYASEPSAELRVVVADDNLWRAVHGGVSRLLSAPLVGRRIRHRGMEDRSATQVQEERGRTPRGTACRTSARSHTPTSRGFAERSTSFGRRLGVECGACNAESFACKRGCLA